MSFPFDVQLVGGAETKTYATKGQRLGQRGFTEDGRVFRYMRADPTYGITYPYWAAADSHKYDTSEAYDCLEATTSTAKVIGDFTLDAVDTNTDHVADWFAEGYAFLTVGSIIYQARIRKNTAGHATTAVVFSLYNPLPLAVAAGSQIQVFPSIYSAVVSCHPASGGNDGQKVKVCMPIVPVTKSYYFWGQTWGPCMGIPSEAFPRGTYEADLVFSSDGSVKLRADWSANNINQHAGYRIPHYTEDPTGALIYFQLEIAP